MKGVHVAVAAASLQQGSVSETQGGRTLVCAAPLPSQLPCITRSRRCDTCRCSSVVSPSRQTSYCVPSGLHTTSAASATSHYCSFPCLSSCTSFFFFFSRGMHVCEFDSRTHAFRHLGVLLQGWAPQRRNSLRDLLFFLRVTRPSLPRRYRMRRWWKLSDTTVIAIRLIGDGFELRLARFYRKINVFWARCTSSCHFVSFARFFLKFSCWNWI